ncbi:MAG TPA: VOC family protein [Thermoanaerobaculia bacterium]
MTQVDKHDPGSFSWPELMTSNPAVAKTFYASLFGWSFEDSPAGPDMVYTTLKMNGRSVGALYQDSKQTGIPPHWNTYVTVASADGSAKKAKDLGGKVVAEPFDVMEYGRMAVVQDPTGAMICVWEPKKHIGAQVVNEPGALCWAELDTTDTDAAEKFYTGLFAWGAKVSPEYTEWQKGGTSIGGMMKIPKEWGPVPPNWLVYFASDDVDATAAKASKSGGRAIVPPTNIPDMGRFAVLADPQGAAFAVFRPAKGW